MQQPEMSKSLFSSIFSRYIANCFFPLQSIKPESKVCSTELTRESITLCLFQTLDTAKTGSMYLPEANCLQHSAIKTSVSGFNKLQRELSAHQPKMFLSALTKTVM